MKEETEYFEQVSLPFSENLSWKRSFSIAASDDEGFPHCSLILVSTLTRGSTQQGEGSARGLLPFPLLLLFFLQEQEKRGWSFLWLPPATVTVLNDYKLRLYLRRARGCGKSAEHNRAGQRYPLPAAEPAGVEPGGGCTCLRAHGGPPRRPYLVHVCNSTSEDGGGGARRENGAGEGL